MRRGGGKQKGASFEREICVSLSQWVTHGAMDDVFWRSAMSGGRSTVAFAKGKRMAAQAGDISCIHPAGHAFSSQFHIECKFYANLDYVGLLTGKGHFCQFWEETRKQAKQYGKHPILIAKQNRILPMVGVTRKGAKLLNIEHRSLLTAPRVDLRIIPLHEFLTYAEAPE